MTNGWLPATSPGPDRPPSPYRAAVEQSVTCELATLTRRGAPVTTPLTPYPARDGDRLDVSTGLTYPGKAERARRNPKVGVVFRDPVGRADADATVVVVRGLATVRDADIQANTDRYVRVSAQKLPQAMRGVPRLVQRTLAWYFARIWITVTPLVILWWPGGDLTGPPETWTAPLGTVAPPTDPAPIGAPPPPWKAASPDWRARARSAAAWPGGAVLTTVDDDGFPLPVPCPAASLDAGGFALTPATGAPVATSGPACVTFHVHDAVFTGQQNAAFAGGLRPAAHGVRVDVDHVIGDWSLGGGLVRRAFNVTATRRRLHPRLASEAARRSQSVPKIRFPARPQRQG